MHALRGFAFHRWVAQPAEGFSAASSTEGYVAMSIPLREVVIEGVYTGPDNQERIVRQIVNGKVVYEVREEHSEGEWCAGHSLEDSPSIEKFADACFHVTSKPIRYSKHDTV
jgi:hypothetical protein